MFRIPSRRALKPALTLFLALIAALPAPAELLKSKLGFFVEMPAGFRLVSGDGSTKYSFTDPNGGMEFDILCYERGRYPNIDALAEESLVKLGSQGETNAFVYEGRRAVFAELGFGINDKKRKGYAVFIDGRAEYSYALLASAGAEDFEAYADFILSCLDAFSIDRAALRSPGPVSQFSLAWPPERKKEREVSLAPMGGPDAGASSVALPWSDEEAAQEADTVEREYKVLVAYAKDPDLSQEAWTRFYRLIYRESAARLDRLALEAARLLPRDDPTETARRVLAWVQRFVYERDEKGTDFIPPLTAAFGARGDCDSRAVVASIILERLGIDSIILVSREYSHALLGVDVPGGGQRFERGGKSYLMGETTAKVGLGTIPADMTDRSKWLAIELGD
jgi:hypothetical protein